MKKFAFCLSLMLGVLFILSASVYAEEGQVINFKVRAVEDNIEKFSSLFPEKDMAEIEKRSEKGLPISGLKTEVDKTKIPQEKIKNIPVRSLKYIYDPTKNQEKKPASLRFTQSYKYMEKTKDNLYEIKRMDIGITILIKVQKISDGKISFDIDYESSNFVKRNEFKDAPEFNVGKPIVDSRGLKSSLSITPGKTLIIGGDSKSDKQSLLLLISAE